MIDRRRRPGRVTEEKGGWHLRDRPVLALWNGRRLSRGRSLQHTVGPYRRQHYHFISLCRLSRLRFRRAVQPRASANGSTRSRKGHSDWPPRQPTQARARRSPGKCIPLSMGTPLAIAFIALTNGLFASYASWSYASMERKYSVNHDWRSKICRVATSNAVSFFPSHNIATSSRG